MSRSDYGHSMPVVVLKPGHVQPIWSGHPWVYAQAVERIEGGAMAGEEVSVVDPRGNFIGRGFYSPGSAIPVRILTRDNSTQLGAEWVRNQLMRARELRRELGLPNERTNGYRLVHSEGDQVPGLIVDVFDDVAAVQLNTIGMKRRQDVVFDSLFEMFKLRAIVDRTPLNHSKSEGFEPSPGVVRGEPIDRLRFVERDLVYEVPLELGQKTGFYFDQRPLRARVEQIARGKRVLDVYSYVGSFAMAAARGGASQVVAVDESALALEVAGRCAVLNSMQSKIAFSREPARAALTRAGQAGGFDLVVVDPPSLAPSQRMANRAMSSHTTWWVVGDVQLLSGRGVGSAHTSFGAWGPGCWDDSGGVGADVSRCRSPGPRRIHRGALHEVDSRAGGYTVTAIVVWALRNSCAGLHRIHWARTGPVAPTFGPV